MRINLTKRDLVNAIYMQVGFSKQITENLVEEFFSIIISNLSKKKTIKISKFGTFLIRSKSSRVGRNPKTKEEKEISKRDVVLFKPSKEFKELLNNNEYRINMVDNASDVVAKNRGSTEIQYKYIQDFVKHETNNSNNKTL